MNDTDDPDLEGIDLRTWDRRSYERAQNHKRLEQFSVGNRFRLMAGLPLLLEKPQIYEPQPQTPS